MQVRAPASGKGCFGADVSDLGLTRAWGQWLVGDESGLVRMCAKVGELRQQHVWQVESAGRQGY